MIRKSIFILFSFLIFFQISADAEEKKCAKNIQSFRELFKNEKFPLKWIETTMDDGKPLVVEVREEKGALFLEFNKTKEGLWASGTADVCEYKEEVMAIIDKDQIKLGSAAHWIQRMAMGNGAKFRLKLAKPDLLKISAAGWHGDFVPLQPQP